MKSILLIDSDMDVATGLQHSLCRFGFHVEVADSHEFDLILINSICRRPYFCWGRAVSPLFNQQTWEMLIETSHQFRDTNFKRSRYGDDVAQTYLSCPALNMRYMHLAHSGMLSEIDLSPAAFPSQLANSFAEQDANICCHPVMMELSFRINLSYAISHKQLLPLGAQTNSSGQMAYLTAEMDI